MPGGHGDPLCTQKLWARKNLRARKTDWHGDLRARGEIDKEPRMNTNGHEEGTADDADGRRWVYGMGGMRPLRGRMMLGWMVTQGL